MRRQVTVALVILSLLLYLGSRVGGRLDIQYLAVYGPPMQPLFCTICIWSTATADISYDLRTIHKFSFCCVRFAYDLPMHPLLCTTHVQLAAMRLLMNNIWWEQWGACSIPTCPSWFNVRFEESDTHSWDKNQIQWLVCRPGVSEGTVMFVQHGDMARRWRRWEVAVMVGFDQKSDCVNYCMLSCRHKYYLSHSVLGFGVGFGCLSGIWGNEHIGCWLV